MTLVILARIFTVIDVDLDAACSIQWCIYL